MKTTIVQILRILLISLIFIQTSNAQDSKKNELSQEKKKSILMTEFARIATGTSFSSIGNFASISSTDKTLSASTFFLTKKDNIINLEVSGGGINGIASLFEEGKLNTKASLGISYSFILNSIEKVQPAALINQHEIDIIELEKISENEKLQKRVLAVLSMSRKKDKYDDLKIVSHLESKLKDPLNLAILKAYKDSINSRKYTKKDSISILILAYQHLHDKKIRDLDKKLSDIKAIASSFAWISFGYKATNDTFLLFDESNSSNQLLKQSYTSQSLFFSFNKQSNLRFFKDGSAPEVKKREFFTLGAKIDITNNLSALDKVEIIDRSLIGSGGREKLTRQNAFSGNYMESLTNGSVYFDYYKFLSLNDGIAFHANPTLNMRENFKPVTSIQFGLLLPFKNLKKKESTIVNLEIFYRFNDVFNTTNSDNSLLNRNTIGIQGTFPFNL